MVYMLLTDGFEEIEAIVPLDILRRCGVEVTTVGVNDVYIRGAHDITVKADVYINELTVDDNADMLIIPGGPGHVNIEKSEEAVKIIERFHKEGKYIAAICAAPSIIGRMGLLNGKKATCFPGFEKELKGAKPVDKPVVVDGKIITSKGAGTAEKFAFALAEILIGGKKADSVYKSMQCGK